jgi:hypothetical protein
MKLINQKLTKYTEDPIISINVSKYNPTEKIANKKITIDNITKRNTQNIETWLKTYVDEKITHNDVVNDVNDIFRIFMAEYNITLPDEFNTDLILFLFNNSIH